MNQRFRFSRVEKPAYVYLSGVGCEKGCWPKEFTFGLGVISFRFVSGLALVEVISY